MGPTSFFSSGLMRASGPTFFILLYLLHFMLILCGENFVFHHGKRDAYVTSISLEFYRYSMYILEGVKKE